MGIYNKFPITGVVELSMCMCVHVCVRACVRACAIIACPR